MTMRHHDPITLEIIQNSLQAAADEMFAAMRKTAMSSIIYEVLDMGTGITDAEGEIASSGAGIPAFVGVLDKSVKAVIAKFDRPGDVEPGDVFATNDPYSGGVTHLNDIVVMTPVFHGGKLIAWTANIAHNSDVGGMAPGSLTGEATSIFQEGLRLPAIKIIARGQTIEPVMQVIKVNSRMPDVLEGDVWAAIASVRVGARRVESLAEKYGTDTFTAAIESFMDVGEQASLNALAKLPGGTFELSEEQDNGQVYNVGITIAEDRFTVDLRDNPDQLDGPLNTSRDGVMVAAQMIFKSLTDPYSPANGGSFRPLELLTRSGSVFDAREPAPLGFYYDRAARVRPDVAVLGETHAGALGRGTLRVGVRHVHRRHPSGYRTPVHGDRTAARWLGCEQGRRWQHRDVLRVSRGNLQLPGGDQRGAERVDCRADGAEYGAGRRRQALGRPRNRAGLQGAS